MKILVCAHEYYPLGSGIANVAYNIVKEFKKKGIKTIVCSPIGPDVKLGNNFFIDKTGIFGIIDFWLKVSKLNLEKYDVVWFHQPLIIRKISINKLIVTIHSTYYSYNLMNFSPKKYYQLAAKIEKYCLNKLPKETKFIGVSRQVCKELGEIGIEKERIKYIPNGVDTEKFKPRKNKREIRKKLGLPTNKKIILSIGRLTEQKQPLKLIDVFSKIEKELKNVVLVIVGKGELLEKTKEYAKKSKNIIFLGYVPNEKLSLLYSCSDYYISTSKYEGGEPTLALAEAMASGLPCIVSDIPNFRIIKDYNCGILVNFNSTKITAEKINKYLEKDNYQHSKNARRYSKNISWKNIANIYLNLFEMN